MTNLGYLLLMITGAVVLYTILQPRRSSEKIAFLLVLFVTSGFFVYSFYPEIITSVEAPESISQPEMQESIKYPSERPIIKENVSVFDNSNLDLGDILS